METTNLTSVHFSVTDAQSLECGLICWTLAVDVLENF